MMKRLDRVLVVLAALACLQAASAAGDESQDFFEAKIRPVLVGTCFPCHGAAKVSGELRIDSRESLLRGGESGPAIAPGNPEESLLLRALERRNDVSAMPPDKEKALRPDQIADFAAWIKAGAVWPARTAKFETSGHWSFQPLSPVAPPKFREPSWAKNCIDAFLGAKQPSAGLHSAAPADKRTLIRRVTFDLTGLPPTPDEVEDFLNDTARDAFERVVERLLQSPAYGERWGRHWLDVVRYADTAGETADYPAPLAWRYRNYVIDAFNADKPYDEFLREQIAGDILASQGPPERYAERVTATGFLAISRRFGFDSENYHHLTIQDTIDTLGQAVLGLSLGCARCHDHKFDAVTMRDYYALYGIFDSSRYPFPGSEQKQRMRAMAPLLPPQESRPAWREHQGRIAALATTLAKHQQAVPDAVLRSLQEFDGDFELQAPAAGGSKGVLVPPWRSHGKLAVTNTAQSPFKHVYPSGKVGLSVPADAGEYRVEQAIYPSWTTEDGIVYLTLDFRVAASTSAGSRRHRISLGPINHTPAIEVYISSDSIALQSDEPGETRVPLRPSEWHSLQLTIDLAHDAVSGKVVRPGWSGEFCDQRMAAEKLQTIECVAFDSVGPTVSPLAAIEFDNLSVQAASIPPLSTEPSSDSSLQGVETAALQERLNQAKQELDALLADGPFPMAYGMAEGTPHDARLQLRGEPDQLGAEVPRGFVRALGGESLPTEAAGSGRLELAHWLTRPDHPLAARVMVNRIWQHHFGQALVKTPNDFGVRGLPPTHPELLDYLAAEFIRSGWSLKAMHRLILRSAAWQQASGSEFVSTDSNAVTAANDFYLSFPRRRLGAEEIRDAILFVSGELDATPGREHPFPSPIRWGYTQHNPFLAVYESPKRSVYLMTQRLKRHPFLALFDGPDPNATTAERLTTTVPTQALFFLNDPFVHAATEKWAARLMAAHSDDRERIAFAWRQALGRLPSDAEGEEAKQFLSASRAELAALNSEQIEVRSLAACLRALVGSNEFLHVD